VRDAIDAFRELDTEPYGVNPADAASHRSFIEEQHFPFDLLIDEGLHVARVYDALRPDGDRINRTVAVIGKNGRLLFYQHGAPPPEEIIAAIVEADDEGDG
jgi:peroxiredoxin